ncbi:MAG: DUF4149 domain-containing protein [Nitrospirae bacterium]|nr:DUF4149 domain-containing protein [Nitrospirota bacterium]
MKIIASFFIWLELLGLGVWIGGMVILGAVVAPTVFNAVKPVEMAGDAMSLVFHRFNGEWVFVCIGLVVLGFVGKWLTAPPQGMRMRIEAALIIVLVLSGLYIGAILGPRMQTLRQITLTDRSNGMAVAEFDHKHKRSVQLFSVNILLGLAVLWMNSRPSSGSNRKET